MRISQPPNGTGCACSEPNLGFVFHEAEEEFSLSEHLKSNWMYYLAAIGGYTVLRKSVSAGHKVHVGSQKAVEKAKQRASQQSPGLLIGVLGAGLLAGYMTKGKTS